MWLSAKNRRGKLLCGNLRLRGKHWFRRKTKVAERGFRLGVSQNSNNHNSKHITLTHSFLKTLAI